MVTAKYCNICMHPIDNHLYKSETIDTVMGKQNKVISYCDVKDCTCDKRKIKRIQKEAINQLEHG